MTSALFLGLGLAAALLPAAVAVALSGEAAAWYNKVVQPGLLLASSLLSLWASTMYRSHLRQAFLFLAGFLLSYGVVNITPLLEEMREALDGNFLTVLLLWQVLTYLMLFVACVSTLRAIDVTRLARWGLPVVGLTLILAVGILVNGVPTFLDHLEVSTRAAVQILLIRIFDMIVMLMLVPVILLFVQSARAKYRESATFSFVLMGIIASLILVYIYELVTGQSIAEIAASDFQQGSVLDGLYLFAYFTVVVGLYAHRKHHDWSLRRLERAVA